MFGTQDSFDCVVPKTFQGPNHDQVCLASKVSLHFVGAGVYLSDEGYVLKVSGKEEFYSLTPANLKDLQSAQLIPDPLPPYHIAWYQYVIGYSLWIIIGIVVLISLLQRFFGKLRPFLATMAAPFHGPPLARTDGDKWLVAELGKHLEPGEKLQQLALATNFAPGTTPKNAKSIFIALSDRRLMFMDCKLGFTGRIKSAENFSARPRSDIARVVGDQLYLYFAFTDETAAQVWIVGSQGKYSNQWLFARDVPHLIAVERANTPPGTPPLTTVNA